MLPITLCGGNGVVMSSAPPMLRWNSDCWVNVWPRTVMVGPGSPAPRPAPAAGCWPAAGEARVNTRTRVALNAAIDAFMARTLPPGTKRGQIPGEAAPSHDEADRLPRAVGAMVNYAKRRVF